MRATFTTVDEEEAKRLLKSTDLCSALYDFQIILDSYYKGGVPKDKTADEFLDLIRDQWYENLSDNNVDLGELWS